MALFVALGGTALAAATIGSGNIRNDAVLSRHIKDGAVKNPDLGANSVGTGKVIDGSLLAQGFKAGQLPKGDKGDPCLSSDPACKGPKGDKGNSCLSSDPACKGPKGDTGARGPSDAFTNYGSVHTISMEVRKRLRASRFLPVTTRSRRASHSTRRTRMANRLP